MDEKRYTTRQVFEIEKARLEGEGKPYPSMVTVQKWAARSGVGTVGPEGKKIFTFTDADLARFRVRRPKGWPTREMRANGQK
jgi:hypothetical protein